MIYLGFYSNIVVIVHRPTGMLQKLSSGGIRDATSFKDVSLYNTMDYAQKVLDKVIFFQNSARKREDHEVILVSIKAQERYP